MEYRHLGGTELKVSELCLGTMQFGWTVDEPKSFDVLTAAYEQGVNFIDTANVYSRWAEGNPGGVSESIIGKWMKTGSIPRNKVVLATKVRGRMGEGPNDEGLSRRHIMSAVEDSLRRLQTDYIDLYQTHSVDENTPIEETLLALDDLVHQGKVRYIGCSNYPAWRLMEALWTSDRMKINRFDCIQPIYSIAYRDNFEREQAAVCKTYGLAVIPYSPLGGGFLTGKYRRDKALPDSVRVKNVESRYMNDRNWDVLEQLERLGKKRNKTISQMSLGWLLNQDLITAPIIGPRNLNQLEDNLGAAGLRLTQNEMDVLNKTSSWQ